MSIQLEKSILATVVYYDIFEYPLTLIELHRWLLQLRPSSNQDYSLADIQNTIHESALLQKAARTKNGFFYLRGRDEILEKRHERYTIAEQKYKGARNIIKLISRLPFVRAIVICNSLAYHNTSPQSDIDLVIITKHGGVWWDRLFSLLFLSLLQRRPEQRSAKEKICLSFFIDENHLDIRNLRMGERDIDFSYWVVNFYPVYDSDNFYQKFWNVNKEWLSSMLPQAQATQSHPLRLEQHKPGVRIIFEWLLSPFGFIAQFIQEKKFPKQIRELLNQDTRVRVQEGVLKFHVNDRRLQHLEEFVKRYEAAMV